MEPAEARAADPVDRVFALLQGYRDHMEREHCCMGCPIGNLALEISDHNAKARALVHRNFENWAARVASWFERDSRLPTAGDRRRLARFVLTVMEGGLMQARAANHLGPFDEAVDVLRDYLSRLGPPPDAKPHQSTPTTKKRRRR